MTVYNCSFTGTNIKGTHGQGGQSKATKRAPLVPKMWETRGRLQTKLKFNTNDSRTVSVSSTECNHWKVVG